MIDGGCRAAAHLRRACSLARELMMRVDSDAKRGWKSARRRGAEDSDEGRILHSQSVWAENELAQTTVSESPKYTDDGPGVVPAE